MSAHYPGSDDAPAADVTVPGGSWNALIDTGGRQIAVVRAGPEGSYWLPVPTAGSYLVAASASGHHPAASLVSVRGGSVRHEIVLSHLDDASSSAPGEAMYELGGTHSDHW